jgi:tetratricopeptide (TPR) repeat protein
MEVFSYDPGRTRFISQEVTRGVMTASLLLEAGRPAEAFRILEFQNRVEPGSARVHYLMAVAATALGRLDQADAELRIALRLQADHWPARVLRAEIMYRRGNVVDAREMLDTVLSARPDDPAARQLLVLLSGDSTALRITAK